MIKRVLLACLAAAAMSAHATAITFVDVTADATAVAITDGTPGADSQASPPATTPVTASADSIGTTGVAIAGAIATGGLLQTTADVSSAGDLASAVGMAHFAASFVNEARMLFDIGLTSLDLAFGSGSASTSLFVVLFSDGVKLFEDYITGSERFDYRPVPGSLSTIDLTLVSEASAGLTSAGFGGAQGFGLVVINAIPLPATWLLVLVAAGAVLAVRRRGIGSAG